MRSPRSSRYRSTLGYASRLYRRTPDQLPGLRGFAIAGAPPTGRNGVVLAQEGDLWNVTLGGYHGDFAPLDPQGFVEFARGMPTPELYQLIKDAEPLSDPLPYRFKANLRRHYDQLRRFPDGYLVFGDAICSFNPVYAQGMTVAANEALVLQACPAQGSANLAQRFFKDVRPVLDGPWKVAVGNDLQLPHVEGSGSRMDRFMSWYIGKLHIAARNDAALSVVFLEVVNMMAPPPRLLHPSVALRILRGNLARDFDHDGRCPACRFCTNRKLGAGLIGVRRARPAAAFYRISVADVKILGAAGAQAAAANLWFQCDRVAQLLNTGAQTLNGLIPPRRASR